MHIAAMGMLSAYGSGLMPVVEGMRAGHCPMRAAEGIGYPVSPAPQVSGIPLRDLPPGDEGAEVLLLETVDQMLTQWPGDRAALRSEDTALVIGSGGFLYASGAELYWRSQQDAPPAKPFYVRGPHWGAELIARHLGLRGPVVTLTTGCSSSANAILSAQELIQRRRARRALIVGAEGLSAVTLSGFESLMLLDPAGCRPFDVERAGLQIGEGYGALMVEEQPEGRGTGILAGANLCDTHHLTSAGPDGSVMRDAMLMAIRKAGASIGDIVAIKAHGTGSADSDRAEASALHAVFGAALPPVIGLKRYLGHTLGACGVLETAAMLSCLRAGFLPVTAGFTQSDPELRITPTLQPVEARSGLYLLNYFGFGGNYTSLVLAYRNGD